ncbi:MAG: cation:proton antiporter [Rhodospirillaceae bacterium]|nr:cation:proton antiporter [Rhodospirillaceae bacterium]
MTDLLVLRVVVKLLIPFILLFGLYVQMHGDYGPGGGFQAGVIFGSGFILYGMVFGLETMERVAPMRLIGVMIGLGVLIYAGTGYVTMALGGLFLEYGLLDHHDPSHGQHYGIFSVEAGVGITVASVMILIFHTFASRKG